MVFVFALLMTISIPVFFYYKCSLANNRDKYHTFWPRFFAPYVDGLVTIPIIWVIHILVFNFELPSVLVFLLSVIVVTIGYVYNIYFHGKYGQTIGKMACKVKVVNASTEEAISFKHALLRDSIPLFLTLTLFAINPYSPFAPLEQRQESIDSNYWITKIPMIWFWAEVITMLTNDRRRAIHDFIAGTVVIRTNIKKEVCEEPDVEVKAS